MMPWIWIWTSMFIVGLIALVVGYLNIDERSGLAGVGMFFFVILPGALIGGTGLVGIVWLGLKAFV